MPKKIVEVAVDDNAFLQFQAKFKQYQDGLDESVAAWVKIGATTKAASSGTGALAGAMGTIVGLMAEQNAMLTDAIGKQKKLGDQEDKRARTVKGVLADTKKIATTIASTTVDLLKWTSIAGIFGTGLGLITGGFGLGGLASTATGLRRSSLSVGVSPGELQASKLSFGQYMDAQGNLEAISNNKGDLAKAWVWRALGVNPDQDNLDVQSKLFDRARQITTSTNPAQLAQTAARTGLDQFYSMDDLRTIRNMSKADLADLKEHLAQSKKEIQVNDALMRTWANLDYTLQKTKTQIEITFMQALAPLAPQIADLAHDFAGTLAELAKDGVIKDFIGKIGEGLHWLDKELQDPKLGAEMHDFLVKIEDVTDGLVNLLTFLHMIPGQKMAGAQTPKQVHDNGRWDNGSQPANRVIQGVVGAYNWINGQPTGKEIGFAKGMMGLGLNAHDASGSSANVAAESGFNPFAVGDHGTAYGIAQWHAARQRDYAILFHHSMQSVHDAHQAMREQMEFMKWELEKRGLLNRTKSGRDSGSLISDRFESPKDRAGNMRSRGELAARIEVHVTTTTGSSASTKVAALAY